MKKKTAILGSTGSIGKSLLKIISKNKKNYEIKLLTGNKNYLTLLKQAKKFNVKYLIITDKEKYKLAILKKKNSKIKIFNNFKKLNVIFDKKIDYVMSSITGLDGLKPTIDIIKFTKKIAIANKESIICGWNLIEKNLKRNNTEFVPVDSEHFSIWYGLRNNNDEIKNIFLTASGGPFLNLPISKFKNIKLNQALNHPNWKMGKKITVDSSTLMNKVFEVIEARNIFNIDYKKISILTHPKSYVHAIVKFNNGLSKILLHEPDMKIPIYNSLNIKNKKIRTLPLKFDTLNKLNFNQVDNKKFPLVNIIYKLPKKISLFETVLITVNDYFVNKFLEKKISYKKLIAIIIKILNMKEFQKYKKIKPKNIEDIYRLRDYVSFKMDSLSI